MPGPEGSWKQLRISTSSEPVEIDSVEPRSADWNPKAFEASSFSFGLTSSTKVSSLIV